MKPVMEVTLLTGGRDKPYSFGLVTALISKGVCVDFIGSDELDNPEWHGKPQVSFLNLRGSQAPDALIARKVSRVLLYYLRLIGYAAIARPKIFHILWNNKFEAFDRVPLMFYYKLLGKKTILTVHNVNARLRDSNDTWFNRLTLKIQYRLVDHLFVHTEKMKRELMEQFDVSESAISVIPFGNNNAVPETGLTPSEAKQRLGIMEDERAILFFGSIAPYKGLEYLVAAFQQIVTSRDDYRLMIAGWAKNCEKYWKSIQEAINPDAKRGLVILQNDYIPDDEIEVYFKAADVLVLPYRYIYQSSVLFLGYRFGLPVIATDMGSLREDIIEGETGFLCRPEDPADLARVIEQYFASDLYHGLNSRRQEIREYAHQRYSWDVVGELTENVYKKLLSNHSPTVDCQVVRR